MYTNNWLIEKFTNLLDKDVIIDTDAIYTYQDLLSEIKIFSDILKHNHILPSQVVAIISKFSFKSIALFMALANNKNIIVPIVSTVSDEINKRLSISQADWKVVDIDTSIQFVEQKNQEKKAAIIYKLQQVKNAGLIIFSSGSTGEPKGMLHDLDNLIEGYKKNYVKNINTLLFMDFSHIGGIDTLFRQLSIGGKLTLSGTWDVDKICSLIEKYKVEVLPTTPTFLNLVLLSEAHKKWDLTSLRIIAYGAEPMPETTFKKLKKIFPNIHFQQKFGSSETGSLKISSKSSDSLFFRFDDKDTKHKVIDNILWLKSKTPILGYLNESKKNFSEDDWFNTGDIVETTGDGYMRIIGRNSDIINVGGQKVFPGEIEEAILKMPQIAACVVYGERSLITGQIVIADIVLKTKEVQAESIKRDLRLFLQLSLQGYKIPVKINIKDKLTQTDTFKIKRNANRSVA